MSKIVQEEPQSQSIAYQWHQEEEQTNHDRQYTSHRPKKSKATIAPAPPPPLTPPPPTLLQQGDHNVIWTTSWQNQQNGMSAQRRLRSAWVSAQSDQSLRCALKWVAKDPSFLITNTHLFNFDPIKPHFYIVKLGFTGVYIIFLILLKT